MADKRTFSRKRKRLIVSFELDGRSYTGFTHDISFTGMFIAAPMTPKIGTDILVDVHLPGGKKVACQGKVVRSRRVLTSLSQTDPNGFSVELTGYFEDFCRAIETL